MFHLGLEGGGIGSVGQTQMLNPGMHSKLTCRLRGNSPGKPSTPANGCSGDGLGTGWNGAGGAGVGGIGGVGTGGVCLAGCVVAGCC